LTRRIAKSRANVAIVGAGPAGLGMARVLRDLAVPDVRVLERDRIGASFRRWPVSTRFISPSFPSNAFGLTDLNAISYDSSPAYALKREHPSGVEYAAYLEQACDVFGLRVETGIDVTALESKGGHIDLITSTGIIRARFVIWAAGQFQYPELEPFDGSGLGVHASRIGDLKDHPGGQVIVIGGSESGIDAAIGLARAGRAFTLLSRDAPWADDAQSDPSLTLSPVTRARLHTARKHLPIELVGNTDVLSLEKDNQGVRVLAADGRSWTSAAAPVLATGFAGSTRLISDWFDWNDSGRPILSDHDESTRLPGLFLVGPEVQHRQHLFCFIYKFRQRFAVVGRAIAGRLGMETEALEAYRANGMYLDDLSCCDAASCLC
jgi:putative flavoprotein involved in K+ transport